MSYGYIPNDMIQKELRWEYVNYALYQHLRKLNVQSRLDHRIVELENEQEAQLNLIQYVCTMHRSLPRNTPSHYYPPKNIPDIINELLKRENELLQEYKSYRNYFLSNNPYYSTFFERLAANKSKQIEQLIELEPCFPNSHDVRQEFFLQDGYRMEKVISELTFPTVIAFDDEKNMYVVEAGYAYGAEPGEGRIFKVSSDGNIKEVAGGFAGPVTGLTWHKGELYVAEGGFERKAEPGCGRIIKVSPSGEKQAIVSNLRTCGDHFTEDVKVGPDEKLYFTVGTATNSGVVGKDNMSWVERNPQFHDQPARDYVLVGKNFVTENPLTEKDDVVETGAFKPFGVPSIEGETIKGDLYANGVIYRSNLDGSNLEIYADGFRNPFGLVFSPFNNKMYVTDNGADVRGSRPINKDWDNFWEVQQGGWYGWPDFFSGLPATNPRFHQDGEPKPSFLIKNHPKLASQPIVRFEPHSSSNKFSFSTNDRFGYFGEAFVAQLGGMDGKSGLKVVRVNLDTGQIKDFYANKKGLDIKAAPIRPVAAMFSPKGDELYIVDFGLMGPREKSQGTGSVWRIVRER